jgi:hypothetical protein
MSFDFFLFGRFYLSVVVGRVMRNAQIKTQNHDKNNPQPKVLQIAGVAGPRPKKAKAIPSLSREQGT